MTVASMLRALLLDMNGVVVDDMPFHERAWIDLAARHGRTLTIERIRHDMSGKSNRDNMRYLFGDALSDTDFRALEDEKEEAYRHTYAPHRAPLPGLRELLHDAREAGVRVALATSAPMPNVDFILDGLDLRASFDAVVTEAEVRHSKPDPAIYLLAAERLGVRPTECVVFEDSLAGLASGRAAGMRAVGIATTHTRDELRDCALVIGDFREVNLRTIEALVP
jgi:beta-phosphoglucomutase family hydrolase